MKYLSLAGITIAALIGLVLISIWNGFVLSTLWAWFVAATFALPLLSIPAAMGISTVVAFLTKNLVTVQKDQTKQDAIIRWVALFVFYPAIALVAGYVITLFM